MEIKNVFLVYIVIGIIGFIAFKNYKEFDFYIEDFHLFSRKISVDTLYTENGIIHEIGVPKPFSGRALEYTSNKAVLTVSIIKEGKTKEIISYYNYDRNIVRDRLYFEINELGESLPSKMISYDEVGNKTIRNYSKEGYEI